MAKLDRLVWTAGIAVTSYGVRVGVRVNNSEVLRQIVDCLPPGWKPTSGDKVERLYSLIVGGSSQRPGVRRFNLVYADGLRFGRSERLEEVLESLEGEIKLYVAEHARRRVFIHAGVVGWNGKAIIIPGSSFSGKTTLVAELVRAGATYYSDEYAVLDALGRVHPYSRPLAIRKPEGGGWNKHSAEELGGRAGIKPLPVGLVLVSSYQAGARWKPRSLSAGQGALALLNNTVSVRLNPEAALDTLERVVSHAPVLKGTRGEARDIADALLSRF